jgi:VCBS repeat-containing protein
MSLIASNHGGKPSRTPSTRYFFSSLCRSGLMSVCLLIITVISAVANAAAPTAVDVYAATQKSTSVAPQSALVFLEGVDIDFDALTYSIVSGPANGSLTEPANGDAIVISGDIAGQSVTFTPTDDFIGTDTFTYRVNDGTTESSIQTATITVFGSFLDNQRQLGVDIDGEAANDLSGRSVALSSDGLTVAIGAIENDGGGESAGHVRVYRYYGTSWNQLGQDINGEASNGQFSFSGWSVALSGDGQTVVIGAPEIFANQGLVRVYQFNGTSWNQLGSDIYGEADGDYSGTSVAMSRDGLTLAIGAQFNNNDSGNAGHVRVYRYIGNSWVQLGADIDGEASSDRSGTSVAMSSDGQTVAIGAIGNDAGGSAAGQVRVYRYNGNSWSQLGFDIDGEAANDGSGTSVALSSDGLTVAIGATGNDAGGNGAGHVRVYRYSVSNWIKLGADIDGEGQFDQSGFSVALSGDGQTVAIGARYNNSGPGNAVGHARVHHYNGVSWIKQGVDINGEDAGDNAGWSVALSSDGLTLAIGAPGNDDTGNNAGHVRVYDLANNYAPTAVDVFSATKKNTAVEPQTALVVLEGADTDITPLNYSIVSGPANGSLTDPDGGNAAVVAGSIAGQSVTYTPAEGFTGTDTFTYSVSDGTTETSARTATITVFDAYYESQRKLGTNIDGEAASDESGTSVALSSDGLTVAIGASRNDAGGHVRVYRYNGTSWSQLGFDIDGEAASDFSGTSVALSSDGLTVAIGASRNDAGGNTAGHVRVYRYNGTSWSQLGFDIDGEATSDFSGTSVALSSDGLTVAIGAIGNDAEGNGAGHVRVYRYSVSNWIKLGVDIDGEAASDRSGNSVALSSDGLTVAIGAPGNDSVGSNAGHVRVYRYNGTNWNQLGFDIDGEAAFDESGTSVGLSSDGLTVAIGAPGYGNNDGHVRVFRYNGISWVLLGTEIDGEADEDSSGSTVALSSDGLTVAIGARFNDSVSINAGHVRVYRYNGTSWSQLGFDIDGEAAGDFSGSSVTLSSDGQMVAIGAPLNDSGGINAGHVAVYDLSNQNQTVFIGDTSASGPENAESITGTLTATNIDGLATTEPYSLFLNPNHGVAFVTANGIWNYIPNLQFSGGDTFTIAVTDGQGGVTFQIITVTVTAINDVPVALDVFAATQKNTSGSPQSALVVLEASDNDFDTLSYRIVSLPANGSLSDPEPLSDPFDMNSPIGGQSITYTPDENFVGTDSFTYRVNDGTTDSPILTAIITVFDKYRESQRKLGADIVGEAGSDLSGTSVAFSSDGMTVAVGATGDDDGAGIGYVRVYRYISDTWTMLGLEINGEQRSDYSGTSVALSSDGLTVAIGAPGYGNNEGHVRVYRYNGISWVLLGTEIDGEADGDSSGSTVALSSDGLTVAIGARFNDAVSINAGHVRVYRYNGTGWSQLGFDIDGEADEDSSGTSVALSSDGLTVAIGAPGYGNNDGHVRIYRYNGDSWIRLGDDIFGRRSNNLGYSVALSSDGMTVAVGTNILNGYVQVYRYDGNNWRLLGAELRAHRNSSVSLSSDGQTVAFGSPEFGRVEVYRYSGSSWILLARIHGEDADDNAGWSVALSSDGQTVAIGAPLNNNGNVRVFDLTNRASIFSGDKAGTGTENGAAIIGTVLVTDPDSLAPSEPYSLIAPPANGAASIAADGSWRYIPNPDFSGTDTFTITVTDSLGSVTQQVITVTVERADTDGDGIADYLDACDNTPFSESDQINSDGCGPSERDTDGDGTNDDQDAFPNNPKEQMDSDSDGYGNNAEAEAGTDPNDANDYPISRGLPIWLLLEAIKRQESEALTFN